MQLSHRSAAVEPFQVMVLLRRAQQLSAQGRDVVHMEAGEPDFATPEPIAAAAIQAINSGNTSYTPALGLDVLREKISAWYQSSYGVSIKPEQVAITAGATGALQLALALTLNAGDEVLIPDPGYPCNRQLVSLAGGIPKLLTTNGQDGFQLYAETVAANWQENTRALMLASPANPTGAMLSIEELTQLSSVVEERSGILIVDEIYHGLSYAEQAKTVLAHNPNAIVLNSFSKYFGMTGWRLGWLIAPADVIPTVERLAQNLFLAPSTIAQHAALAAFDESTLAICEERRAVFGQRRDFLLAALRELGFKIPVTPAGAFYLYADASKFTNDSMSFCLQMLEDIGVAITPGADFGHHAANSHVRFSYTTTMDRLAEGINRLRSYLA